MIMDLTHLAAKSNKKCPKSSKKAKN